MAIFGVKMYRSYEARVEVEASSAEEACKMISDGDFSQAIDDSYEEFLSNDNNYITDVFVYDIDTDYDPLAEWHYGK